MKFCTGFTQFPHICWLWNYGRLCTIKRANLSVKLRCPATLLPKGSMTLLCVTNAVQGLNMKGWTRLLRSYTLFCGQGEMISLKQKTFDLALQRKGYERTTSQQTSQFQVSFFIKRDVLIKIVMHSITGFFYTTCWPLIRVCNFFLLFCFSHAGNKIAIPTIWSIGNVLWCFVAISISTVSLKWSGWG